jgi:hypothetical protein
VVIFYTTGKFRSAARTGKTAAKAVKTAAVKATAAGVAAAAVRIARAGGVICVHLAAELIARVLVLAIVRIA